MLKRKKTSDQSIPMVSGCKRNVVATLFFVNIIKKRRKERI